MILGDGVPHIQTQVVSVTPALAEKILEKNTFNRNVSSAVVRKYAADMSAGKWTLNHQGIAFDRDGTLIDGQHRLMAIIQSGATILMLVTHGADRIGVDELRPRSTGDVIKFGGLSDWLDTRMVQIARAMISIDRDRHVITPTAHEVVAFAEHHKTSIVFVNGLFRNNKRGIASAVVKASFAIAHYCDAATDEEFEDIVNCLYTGFGTEERYYPIQRLAQILAFEIKLSGQSERRRAAWLTMKAIKDFADNRALKVLRMPAEAPFQLDWNF